MTVRNVTDEQFKNSLKPQGVTLVDFGAPWCPPCRTLLPILEELDRELDGEVSILKVNADESPEAAAKFGVMSMPTVILFKDGQPIEKLVGLRPKEQYKTTIARHLQG